MGKLKIRKIALGVLAMLGMNIIFDANIAKAVEQQHFGVEQATEVAQDKKVEAILSTSGDFKEGERIKISLDLVNLEQLSSADVSYKYDNRVIKIEKITLNPELVKLGFGDKENLPTATEISLKYSCELVKDKAGYTGSTNLITIEATVLVEQSLIL